MRAFKIKFGFIKRIAIDRKILKIEKKINIDYKHNNNGKKEKRRSKLFVT